MAVLPLSHIDQRSEPGLFFLTKVGFGELPVTTKSYSLVSGDLRALLLTLLVFGKCGTRSLGSRAKPLYKKAVLITCTLSFPSSVSCT